jgi:hypothetical protein
MAEEGRLRALIGGFPGEQRAAVAQGIEVAVGQEKAVPGEYQGSLEGKGKIRVSVSPDDKPGHPGAPGNPGQILRPVSQKDGRIETPFPGPAQNRLQGRKVAVGVGNN